jgi:hypothetical protein
MPLMEELTWDQFWGSYNIYASHFDYDPAKQGTLEPWKRLSFKPCATEEWIKDIPDDDSEKTTVRDRGICLDTSSLLIENGDVLGGKRLMLDLYSCQPDSPVACTNEFAGKFFFFFGAYSKTIDVRNFNNPFKLTNKKLHRILPQSTMRYNTDVILKWTDLYTGVGNFSKTWKQEKIITLFSYQTHTAPKSMDNISFNFASQGRVIMADWDWHLEIISSNHKTEVYRHYFSVLDIFSAVGGL